MRASLLSLVALAVGVAVPAAAQLSRTAQPEPKQGYWWYQAPPPKDDDADPEALAKPRIPPMAELARLTPPKIRKLIEAQRDYAASDVRFLHAMKEVLDARLAREGRTELAQACFDFLPTRAALDLAGWPEVDIFAHM